MRAFVISGFIGALMFWNVGTSLGASVQGSCWYGTIQRFLTCPTGRSTAGVSTWRESNNDRETSAGGADPAASSGSTNEDPGGKGGSGSGGSGSGGSGSGASGSGGSGSGGSNGHGEGGASGHSDNNDHGQGNHEHK